MSLYSDPQPLASDPDRPATRGRVAERRARRRRRALRRLDILVGLIVGGIWLLIAPGVAMAGIVAVLVLLLAGSSWYVGRRRARRALRPRRPRRRRRRGERSLGAD